jgi:hypothetical protein
LPFGFTNASHNKKETMTFDIFKMRAIFKSVWVRKLIGKLGVPYCGGLHTEHGVYPSAFAVARSIGISLRDR